MLKEKEIGGVVYLPGRISAVDQCHLFIKLSPVLAGFIRLRISMIPPAPKEGEAPKPESPEKISERTGQVAENIEKLAIALSRMPKDDVNFVLETCLIACKKRIGPGIGEVWVRGAGLTDQSLELFPMLELVWLELEGNLSSFFDSAGSILANFIKPAQ